MSKIACVIPAYNEERFIAGVIRGVPSFVDHIIVVNDASRDATAAVVAGLDDPRIVLIHHATNQGVGGAVVSGYRKGLELGVEVVVKLDGDGQMDPTNMRRLIAPVIRGEADYAKGVRFREGDVLKRMPALRLIGNLGLSFLTKAASGYWNIFDPTNGYTALGRAGLERLRMDRLNKGYFFESDMLINLYRIDAVVVDVPMKAQYGNERSKLNLNKVFLTFPYYLLRAFIKRILWRYYIRDFTALSAFLASGVALLFFGLSFGVYKWLVNGFRGVGTPPGTIMLAAVPVILGFQLLLQGIVLDINGVPRTPLSRLDPIHDDFPDASAGPREGPSELEPAETLHVGGRDVGVGPRP